MARTKGAKNKESTKLPSTMTLSTEERIEFLATILVDRIMDAQTNGSLLRVKLRDKSHANR
jgi:hypothetical protein